MYNAQAIYISAVRSFIFESCNFTHIWKALAWQHNFTKRGCLVNTTSLTPPCCTEVPVPSQESVQWYIYERGIDFVSFSDFSTVFWKRSDSVVIFVLHYTHSLRLNKF
jgi:hypothetical protein